MTRLAHVWDVTYTEDNHGEKVHTLFGTRAAARVFYRECEALRIECATTYARYGCSYCRHERTTLTREEVR